MFYFAIVNCHVWILEGEWEYEEIQDDLASIG
jgi:hypothetical protein